MSEETRKKTGKKRAAVIIACVACAAVLAALIAVLKPSITFNAVKPIADMTDAQRDAYALVVAAQVSKHMLVPAGVPQITAASENYSALVAEGGFWQDLAREDIILVYPEQARIIVWRPSKKLIVNAGPIISGD